MKTWVRVDIEAADVELRQGDEGDAVGGDSHGGGQGDGLPEPHSVRDDRALRVTGRAGCVKNGGDVVVGQGFGVDWGRGGLDQAFVGAVVRVAVEYLAHATGLGEGQCRVLKLRIVDEKDR